MDFKSTVLKYFRYFYLQFFVAACFLPVEELILGMQVDFGRNKFNKCSLCGQNK